MLSFYMRSSFRIVSFCYSNVSYRSLSYRAKSLDGLDWIYYTAPGISSRFPPCLLALGRSANMYRDRVQVSKPCGRFAKFCSGFGPGCSCCGVLLFVCGVSGLRIRSRTTLPLVPMQQCRCMWCLAHQRLLPRPEREPFCFQDLCSMAKPQLRLAVKWHGRCAECAHRLWLNSKRRIC